MKGKIITVSVFCFLTAATFAVFFVGCKTVQSNETLPQNRVIGQASPTAMPTAKSVPQLTIKSDEVSSLTLETVYKNYFDEGSKCRKTYNEFFGNEDGAWSPSSPCTMNVLFDRDGGAAKTIEIRRYDKTAKEYKTVEKSIWKAKIPREQFDALAKTITENKAFKAWQDGIMINVSNSEVSATHPKGTRTVMSNVDEKTIQFLPMLDAFKQLDKKIDWEKLL